LSNYTQSTNFATKDALTSGDPLKILKGTEINTEFANIAIAVATKADTASPTFTGTPVAPTASANNNSTQLATTAYIDAAITAVKTALFPVGTIYTAIVSTNPGTLLGFGTWTAFGAGRVLVGFNSANALFDTAEETGGSADAVVVSHTHTFTGTALAPHAHTYEQDTTGGALSGQDTAGLFSRTTVSTSSVSGGTPAGTNSTEGVSGTNANYQPYITVYMWKRTA
jgi:hypothetical protein